MNLRNKTSKVAIVHDDFIQSGGAEKLVECFLEIFPQADLYTSIISYSWEQKLLSQNPNLKIFTSFINKIPFKGKLYKSLALLYPVAFWSFNFTDYDLVLSSTARFAHGIRTSVNTKHVAYVNSPARMIWEPDEYFNKLFLVLIYPFIYLLRLWDKHVSTQPDVLIANSKTIQLRIKKYWHRESRVIYPYHDLNSLSEIKTGKGDYFLVVSRLEEWKRVDLAIKACSEIHQKLIIVGNGRYKNTLQSTADSSYVKFVGRLSDTDLIKTYLGAKALIMTQKEDFGITSVEAQSLGVPVVAYGNGGALETVIDGKTGIFFSNQSVEDLKQALIKFGRIEIKPEACIIQANKFTKLEFIRRIIEVTK